MSNGILCENATSIIVKLRIIYYFPFSFKFLSIKYFKYIQNT